MRKVNGLALIMIGTVHSLALLRPGIVGLDGIWSEIAGVGYVDAVSIKDLRIWGYYWFLIPGFALIVLGLTCAWVERSLNRSVPAFIGWSLLALASFAVVLDTNTGFWLVLAVALSIIVAARRDRGRPPPRPAPAGGKD
jgi:hypothetical protein